MSKSLFPLALLISALLLAGAAAPPTAPVVTGKIEGQVLTAGSRRILILNPDNVRCGIISGKDPP